MIDEVAKIVAGFGLVVVYFAVLAFRRGPGFPAVGRVEDVGVLFAVQRGFVGFVLLEAVQVFQEEEPGGLFGVVELGGAAGLFPEDVVDVLNTCSNMDGVELAGPHCGERRPRSNVVQNFLR
ncbi:MAG TPA: hypothetical protein VH369_16855 [Bryobacteraceae bacterium]